MTQERRLARDGGDPVRSTFLPFALPWFGPEEREEILAALDSGWITTGPRVKAFETDLAGFTGAGNVVCVDSCTAALHLALISLDLKPGDEVITTPLTFCSTVNTIVHAGGTPVLAEVEADTLNLDPRAVEAAVGPRTRAVLPVHYAGHPADMDPILAIAERHGLAVIEDAAHAIGAVYRGRRVGTIGDMTCFSFYATKNLTTAEGGALATDDESRADRIRLLSLHGLSRDAWKRYSAAGSWWYEVLAPGYKYNMTDLEAALGLHQLRRLPGFQKKRQEMAARYDDAFGDQPAIAVPTWRRDDVEHAYHLYPVRLHPERLSEDRATVIEALRAENIGTSVHFVPIHYHPYYAEALGLKRGAFPVAEEAFASMISLPLFPGMSAGDQDDVIAAVNKVLGAWAIP